MHQVFLCETIHEAARRELLTFAKVTDDWSAASAAEGLISRNLRLDASLLDRLPALRVIAVHGTGTDDVDLRAAAARGIHVFSVPGCNANAVAELIVALALSLARQLRQVQQRVYGGTPYANTLPELAGRELQGKTFGMIGVGHIALRAQHILTAGFGMRAIAWSRSLTPGRAAALGIGYCATAEEVLAQADLIHIGLALNEQTRGMIGRRQLALLKPEALLINTSRGAVLDEEALVQALREGRLAGAACDVFCEEPPSRGHPLLQLPNFIATPHIGANTEEALLRTGLAVVDGLRRFFADNGK